MGVPRVQSSSAPHSGFLPMHTLGGRGDGSGHWVVTWTQSPWQARQEEPCYANSASEIQIDEGRESGTINIALSRGRELPPHRSRTHSLPQCAVIGVLQRGSVQQVPCAYEQAGSLGCFLLGKVRVATSASGHTHSPCMHAQAWA